MNRAVLVHWAAALASLVIGCATGGPRVDSGPTARMDAQAGDAGAPGDGGDSGPPADAPVCSAPRETCGGACVDTATDVRHCGDCDTDCTALSGVDSASVTCVAGACDLSGACAPDHADCDTTPGNGCEADLTSATDCGGCRVACAEPTPNCAPDASGGHACANGCLPPADTRCGMTCVDVRTSPIHCGRCDMPCTAPSNGMPACGGSTCGFICNVGYHACGTSCADDTSAASCGSSCAPCPAPANATPSCSAGSCGYACNPGFHMCGAACADDTSIASCGASCTPCVPPANAMSTCGGGACDFVCNAGFVRSGSTCMAVLPNDVRTGALPIPFGVAETTVTGTTVGSSYDGPAAGPCVCTAGTGNVWYTFTLTQTEVVYFDTFGSPFDTSLFITDPAGTPIAAQAANGQPAAGVCNDDAGCVAGDRWSRTWAYLGAGTYYLAVGGCATGSFTLHAQHFATTVGSYFYAGRISGTGSQATVLVGTSAATPTCGGAFGPSGEDVRWFTTCGATQFFSMCSSDCNGATCGTFSRASGTRIFDPVLYIRSGQTGGEVACNDDGGSMGGTACAGTGGDTLAYASRLADVSVPRGLAVSIVDDRTQPNGMTYTMIWRLNP